jgi:tripartite-type tricarboxylate transporter receptor subunit TctC
MLNRTPVQTTGPMAPPVGRGTALRRRALLTLPSLAAPGLARAQTFPDRPIRVLVGFTPGGSIDMIVRTISPKMTEVLGQGIVVENRPGAGGVVAMEALTRSAADGHTLKLGTVGSMIVQPVLVKDLPYDVRTDVVPVSMTADVANVLVVHPGRPWRTVAELVEAAKARPGELTWAHSGVGTSGFLSAFLLDRRAGIQTTGVAYRGAAPMATDLLAGRVDYGFATSASVVNHVLEGRLRPLAVSSPARQPWFPGVPTMGEAGVSGFRTTNWTGLVAPRGTPRGAIDRIDAACRAALRDPATVAAMTGGALVPIIAGPEEFAALWEEDRRRWEPFVRATGATAN